jgi:oligopeptide/dipeptide ABC transporter ATP-binding protein
MVFQDPGASLNPAHRVGTIVEEPLIVRGDLQSDGRRQRVQELMGLVRLEPCLLDRRPRDLSGGQKQRVAIARALAMEPDVLIADEPLSSLDLSTAAAISELFAELRERLNLAMLYISHDLTAVRRLATRVAVMFAGEIIETGPASMLDAPAHPYTRRLIAATPTLDQHALDLGLLEQIDALPKLPHTAGACYYRERCEHRMQICERAALLLPATGAADHLARCHLR